MTPKYTITAYTYNNARKYGVTVKPSTNAHKKIDVYKNGVKIASVGGYGYKDYPTYIIENGLEYANERRRLYRIRHAKDLGTIGSNGWWANTLLW